MNLFLRKSLLAVISHFRYINADDTDNERRKVAYFGYDSRKGHMDYIVRHPIGNDEEVHQSYVEGIQESARER